MLNSVSTVSRFTRLASPPVLRPMPGPLWFEGSKKTQEATLPVEKKIRDLHKVKIFSGRANPKLAQEVAEYLGTTLAKVRIENFPDGEIGIKIDESVRGMDTFVIQPTNPPVDSNFMELLLTVDALKRAKAKSITLIIPYFGYARQDRRNDAREPISAKVLANCLEDAGATHVVIMDPHSKQIEGFFNHSVDSISALPLLTGYFKNKGFEMDEVVAVSPDEGSVKRNGKFAQAAGIVKKAFIDKTRLGGDMVKASPIIGDDVAGKICVFFDDMISTAGTIFEGVKRAAQARAKAIYVIATHGLFVGPALQRIQDAPIDEVVYTNTIASRPEVEAVDKISQITIAPIIGETIGRILDDESVSALVK